MSNLHSRPDMPSHPTSTMLDMLHSIAARPRIYDLIQRLAGQGQVLERMYRHTANIRAETVLDIGGGTGASRRLWPLSSRYICLDIEMPKLQGFRSRVSGGVAVLSDATHMPIATGAVDVVVCMAVMHHLTDAMLDQVLEEALRVLRVGGQLILLDPVLNRKLLAGRMLWRLDRGSYPRNEEELRGRLETRFEIIHWEKFAIYHEYVLGIGLRP